MRHSAFPIEYDYTVELADTADDTYQFLLKLWAKEKMKHLMVTYYTYEEGSPEAEELKDEIIDISICYNVISPFTSYSTGGGDPTFIEYESETDISGFEDKPNRTFPNPFVSEVSIEFIVYQDLNEKATIKIFDMFGKLIDVTEVMLSGKGKYNLIVGWKRCIRQSRSGRLLFLYHTV